MAAPTFLSAGAITADTTGGASTTPTPPTHTTNDILIAAAQNSAGAAMSTATGGWSQILAIAGTDDSAWFWKRAPAAGTAGPTITASGTDQFALVYVIRGCVQQGVPYESAATNNDDTTSDTTPDTAAIDTHGPDRLVLSISTVDSSAAYSSGLPPGGWTTSSDLSSASGTTCRFTAIQRTEALPVSIASAVVGTFAAGHLIGTLTLAFMPPLDPLQEGFSKEHGQNLQQAVKRGAYFCLGEKWARKGKLWIPAADRKYALA